MTPCVRAFEGRDCAARARVCYVVGRPLEIDDAAFLPDGHVTLTPFSAWSRGARDHVRVTVGGALDASFVVGEREIVIAYGKVAGLRPAALIAAVEARVTARFGSIRYVASRADALDAP